MEAEEYYNKATKDAKEFTEIVNENNLKTSILKLMNGFKNNKTTLINKEIDKIYSEEEVYNILVEHTVELFKGQPCTLDEFFKQYKKEITN